MNELMNCRIAGRETREELTRLIQRLFLPAHGQAPQIVLFSGVDHGVGTSSICAFLGGTLAEQIKAPVVLVDGNFRRPRLHQFFGLEGKEGLANAIECKRGIAQYCRSTQTPGLALLPAGTPQGDLHPLLSSRELPRLWAELRSAFQVVLVDSPPTLRYADATLLGGGTDGLVLVLEANQTRREVARKAKSLLESAGIQILGAILNKRVFPIPSILYGKI